MPELTTNDLSTYVDRAYQEAEDASLFTRLKTQHVFHRPLRKCMQLAGLRNGPHCSWEDWFFGIFTSAMGMSQVENRLAALDFHAHTY